MNAAGPFELFSGWMDEARAAGAVLPLAMALATADADGVSDARMVMVRETGPDGFVFFTDRESAKGDQIRANPRAALLAYWREIGRQVRVSGPVSETSSSEDEAAFRERPRDAQLAIAAWRQGAPIARAQDLPAAVQAVDARCAGGDVPRPERWGGYRLVPDRFLFWEERTDRMHSRQEYRRAADGAWRRTLLAP